MIKIIVIGIVIVGAVVFGALFARKNMKTVNTVVDAAKTIEDQIKK